MGREAGRGAPRGGDARGRGGGCRGRRGAAATDGRRSGGRGRCRDNREPLVGLGGPSIGSTADKVSFKLTVE